MDNAIIVPASSVLQDNYKSYLYIQANQGTFVKREVTVTTTGDKELIIHSGLESGSIIVSEGGIYLR
jgi:cobalt-zinc-cadmium efflux system membrane fusion protein